MEKIVYLNWSPKETGKDYVPEEGWVIRDICYHDHSAIVWLQKSNYFN